MIYKILIEGYGGSAIELKESNGLIDVKVISNHDSTPTTQFEFMLTDESAKDLVSAIQAMSSSGYNKKIFQTQ